MLAGPAQEHARRMRAPASMQGLACGLPYSWTALGLWALAALGARCAALAAAVLKISAAGCSAEPGLGCAGAYTSPGPGSRTPPQLSRQAAAAAFRSPAAGLHGASHESTALAPTALAPRTPRADARAGPAPLAPAPHPSTELGP